MCVLVVHFSRQIAQLILPHLSSYPKLGRKQVAKIVSEAGIFASFPSRRFLGEVARATKKLAVEAENLKFAVPPDTDMVLTSSSVTRI